MSPTFFYTGAAGAPDHDGHVFAAGYGPPRVGEGHGMSLYQPVTGLIIISLHVVVISTQAWKCTTSISNSSADNLMD